MNKRAFISIDGIERGPYTQNEAKQIATLAIADGVDVRVRFA